MTEDFLLLLKGNYVICLVNEEAFHVSQDLGQNEHLRGCKNRKKGKRCEQYCYRREDFFSFLSDYLHYYHFVAFSVPRIKFKAFSILDRTLITELQLCAVIILNITSLLLLLLC